MNDTTSEASVSTTRIDEQNHETDVVERSDGRDTDHGTHQTRTGVAEHDALPKLLHSEHDGAARDRDQHVVAGKVPR